MKRLFIFVLFLTFALGSLALNVSGSVNAFEPATATPSSTRDAPPPDQSQEESSAEIVPTSPGAMTSQILVFNPDTSGEATVQIDIYNASGAIVPPSIIEHVAANGAKLIALPNSLGSNFQGGAVISSDKNVQAITIGANSSNRARDSYEGTSAPALAVTLPLVRHLAASTQNSILAIQNTTASPANVSITFYTLDGTPTNPQTANVAAHRSLYLNTNSIFPGGTFLGSARVVSNQNVAVAAQTRYYKDTAAFSGINSGDTTLYLNQTTRILNAANVPVNWSEIFVRNNGTNPTKVTLTFYAPDGTPLPSPAPVDVNPNGMAQFLLNDSAFAALGSNHSGWAKILSDGQPIAATSLEVLNKGKRMYAVNASAGGAMGSRNVCGAVSRTATEKSRITLLNPDPLKTATIVLRLFDKDSGAKRVQTKIKLLPNSSRTLPVSDALFAAAGSNYQGMATVQAKGAAPPKIVVSVSNPFSNPKLIGTTGYTCGPI
jgi:hypothetical protein